ncbi:MAG: hypothetical protein LBR77_09310 [Lachnospiraceae bacterium]|jgi:trigger factor|nr:hypothetical protein [Lachnospiraceae bacterium]
MEYSFDTFTQSDEEVFARRIDAMVMEVPEALLDEAIEQLTIEVTHKKQYEGMMSGQMFWPDEEERQRLIADIRHAAVMRVKAQLAIDDVIARYGLDATADELEAEAAAMAKRRGMTMEQVKGFLGEDLSMLRRDIRAGKAIAQIMGGDSTDLSHGAGSP